MLPPGLLIARMTALERSFSNAAFRPATIRLALAGVLAATAQFVLATEEVRRRFFGIRSMALLPVLTRVIVCSAIMSLAGHLTLMHSPDWFSAADGVMQRMIRVVLPMCVSAAVYAGCLTLAGLSPIRLLHSAQLLPPDA